MNYVDHSIINGTIQHTLSEHSLLVHYVTMF